MPRLYTGLKVSYKQPPAKRTLRQIEEAAAIAAEETAREPVRGYPSSSFKPLTMRQLIERKERMAQEAAAQKIRP